MKYTKVIDIEDIKVSLLAVWKNIAKCCILALIFFAIGIVLTLNGDVNNAYKASTSLYCPVNGNYTETSSAVQIISSYASLIKSQKVAEHAVSNMGNTNLNYRNVQNMISYSTSSSGINLTINAVSYNPEEAIIVANAVANAFVEEMRTMTGIDAVEILSAAETASMYQNGMVDLWKLRISFFVIGFAVMAVIVFAIELFSDKLRSVNQCLLADDDVILGIIPEIKDNNEK